MNDELVKELELADGTPATIFCNDLDVSIKFQLGPQRQYGKNGCQIEELLVAAADSLINGVAVYKTGYFTMDLDTYRLEKIAFILDACIKRLSAFNKGEFACRENAIALTALETALLWAEEKSKLFGLVLLSTSSTEDMIYTKIIDAVLWLNRRTRDRVSRAVEGTMQP